MGNRALLNRINEIYELQAIIDDLTGQVESLKDEIKSDMTEKGLEEMAVGDHVVRFKNVTSTRFDSATFKDAYFDLYNMFTKTTSIKRFTIN